MNQTDVPPSQVALAWHVEHGLFSISSSPDPGSSCQSMHKPGNNAFPFSLLGICNKQMHKASFKPDANTLTHAANPKQNQAEPSSFAVACTHAHTRTYNFYNPCCERVYCSTHCQHSSLTAIKKTHYKTMSSRENQGIIWTGYSAFLGVPSKKITDVNSMLSSHLAESFCATTVT